MCCTIALMLAAPLMAEPVLLSPYLGDTSDQAKIRYANTPGWEYFRTSSYCYATLVEDGDRLLIGFNHRHQEFHIGFWTHERLPQYQANSVIEVNAISVPQISEDQIGDPIQTQVPIKALVADSSGGRQTINLKVNADDSISMLAGTYLLTFIAVDGKVLHTFTTRKVSAVVSRLLDCTPRY